jgi:iduronate 2-sulfatase
MKDDLEPWRRLGGANQIVRLQVKLCADGLSLAPLLLGAAELSAEHAALAAGAVPALSQWAGKDAMGYTMRTARYRYTEWLNHTAAATPAWRQLLATELYDHETDPEESVNVAAEPAQAANVASLSLQLHAGRG